LRLKRAVKISEAQKESMSEALQIECKEQKNAEDGFSLIPCLSGVVRSINKNISRVFSRRATTNKNVITA
jgi:hypothetical protein